LGGLLFLLEGKNRQLQEQNAGVSPLRAYGETVSNFGRDDAAFVVGGEEPTTTTADSSASLRNDKQKKQ
jgi:hypothetical protein